MNRGAFLATHGLALLLTLAAAEAFAQSKAPPSRPRAPAAAPAGPQVTVIAPSAGAEFNAIEGAARTLGGGLNIELDRVTDPATLDLLRDHALIFSLAPPTQPGAMPPDTGILFPRLAPEELGARLGVWRFGANVAIATRIQAARRYLRDRFVTRVAVVYDDTPFGRAAEREYRNAPLSLDKPYPAIRLGSADAAPDAPEGAPASRPQSLGERIAELRAYRPEGLLIFAAPANVDQVRQEIAAELAPAIVAAVQPGVRESKGRIAFASALLPAPGAPCDTALVEGENAALAFDSMALAIAALRDDAGAGRALNHLVARLEGAEGFVGPCTGMRFRDLRNTAAPTLYEADGAGVRAVVPLTTWQAAMFRAGNVWQVYGIALPLILGFFLVWSVIAASQAELGAPVASLAPPHALAVLGRCIVLLAAYGVLAQSEVVAWDSFAAVAGLVIAVEVVLRVQLIETRSGFIVGFAGLSQVLGSLVERLTLPLRYKNLHVTRNIVAHSNTAQALRAAARDTIAGLRDPHERRLAEKTLQVDLESAATVEARRVVLADLLLRKRDWAALDQDGLVPHWAHDAAALDDPEAAVQRAVRYCEQHRVTPEDLELYVGRLLEGRNRSFADYELVVSEERDETGERARLTMRLRFLVRILGPRALDDMDRIAAEIEQIRNTKSAPVPAPVADAPSGPAPLVVVRVALQNIRCFRALEIDLAPQGVQQQWTMLLGNNGTGKTTVLRAIALALCDQPNATALMQNLSGELLRLDATEGSIRLDLAAADHPGQPIWVQVRLTRVNGVVELRQSVSELFPRARLFVCGYGALRSGFGNTSYEGYSVANALATLFSAEARLQNPELALRRIMDARDQIDRVCRQIEHVLRLPQDSMDFTQTGVTINGPWGRFVPTGAIGDGYLATLAWLADLFGWAFLFRPGFLGEIGGIVLIDEIEKHLHPTWQREIVRQLKAQLPNVQFIASTHSPLCAGGLADLPDGTAAMELLSAPYEEGAVTGEKLQPFRGWTYDRIMTSRAFGLESVRDLLTDEIVEQLRAARQSGNEEAITEMRAKLAERSPVAAHDERNRQVREQVRDTLRAMKDHGEETKP